MEYFNGVQSLIGYARKHVKDGDLKIFCPCINRCNRCKLDQSEVHTSLLKGIAPSYNNWFLHGNDEDSDNDSDSNSGDSEEINVGQCDDMHGLIDESFPQDPNRDVEKFYKLLEEAEQPLYSNYEKYSNLSFIVKLMHIKCINGWSDKSCNMLLEFSKDVYPMCEKLPTSYYDAKKVVKDLGLHYEKIDACENNSAIYYKELADAYECPTCKLSRWKTDNERGGKMRKKIPWKVLSYFSVKTRLQKLFMSSKTAVDMRCHSENRVKDGILRHPVDSMAWKSFDCEHSSFANEHRNVRLGLATDGFNPYGNIILTTTFG
ncbi:hypothetical protein Ddye_020288 [Dipteronia dyeriana]|uniref:Transposase-associated domain-containing protein n=1 Tax=Dipteronia dyeriana TaxID=168575 RepID=A0AAD9WWE2_9ROSI|nr:hypothetical protein Ddye_020288 [Dipteronia dyeriana]